MKRIAFFTIMCLMAIGGWAQDEAQYRTIDTTLVFSESDFEVLSFPRTGLLYIEQADKNGMWGIPNNTENLRAPYRMINIYVARDESFVDFNCETEDETLFLEKPHLRLPRSSSFSTEYLKEDYPQNRVYMSSFKSEVNADKTGFIYFYQFHISPLRFDSQDGNLYLYKKIRLKVRVKKNPPTIVKVYGTVKDQDGNVVPNATLTFADKKYDIDDSGQFSITLSFPTQTNGNLDYVIGDLDAKAKGFTSYTRQLIIYTDWARTDNFYDIRLYNRLDFKAGKRYTLILPETPDASLGRYFRLQRAEGSTVYFERDFEPKGYVPYVIFPYQDTSIDISGMELDPDTLVYNTVENFSKENDYIYFRGTFHTFSYSFPRSIVKYALDDGETGSFAGSAQAMHCTLYYDRNLGSREMVFIDPKEDVHPFIEEGKIWTVGYYHDGDTEPFRYSEYYFDGDTVVAGRTCKRWMERSYMTDGTQENITEIGALYEENRKVWKFPPQSSEPQLLYDFAALKRETRIVNGTTKVNITDERYIYYNKRGMHCSTIQLDGKEQPLNGITKNIWIEGVGNCTSPLDNCYEEHVGDNHRLIYCKVGDTTIFESEDDPIYYVADLRADKYYRPMVERGKQWVVGVWKDGHYVSRKTYTIGRPVVAHNVIYYFLKCATQDKDSHFAYSENVAFIHEGDRQVMVYWETSDPVMLYNFAARSGDAIKVKGFDETYSLGQTLEARIKYNGLNVYYQPNGEPLKSYHLEASSLGNKGEEWIAGVGSLSSPLRNFCMAEDATEERLIMCLIGNDTLYYDNVEADQIAEDIQEEAVVPYRPFIEKGKVWKVGWFPYGNVTAKRLDNYYFEGDTIIDQRKCKQLMCLHQTSAEYPFENGGTTPWTEYIGALYEEGQRVFCAWPGNDELLLLYDFASPVGDTITLKDISCVIAERETRDSKAFKGNYVEVAPYNGFIDSWTYEYIYGYDYNRSVPWVEGIGIIYYDPFKYNYSEASEEYHWLWQCTVGDEVLYKHNNPYIKDGVTPPDDPDVKKQQLDFTHVVKPRPKAPAANSQHVEASSEEETVTGEYSIKELFVNFKTLAGPYTVTLNDVNDKEVYRKAIETSNTVGLATDLARYGNGTYTLTIENDEEQYIATLNIDDKTGIENVNVNGNESFLNHNYYDLSGRRLTVPPAKGVYIHNGRKIVVK